MRKMIASLALALALPSTVAFPLPVQAGDAEADEAAREDAQEAAQIAEAERRGLMLWQYDQAAWHGTDALLASVDDPSSLGYEGWVVTPARDGTGNALRITFYGPGPNGREGKWSAIWTGEKITGGQILEGEQRLLDAEQLRLVAAGGLVEGRDVPNCGKAPLNKVILPGATPDDPVSVYIMTPQVQDGVYPLGGHTRFDIADGEVVAERQFMNRCYWIETGSAEQRIAAAEVTHSLDPVPTEIHVFSMLAMRVALFVLTQENRKIWAVDVKDGRPRIREIE